MMFRTPLPGLKIKMQGLLGYSLLFSILLQPVSTLECYVCDSQEDNEGKCVKTVQLCERNEYHCLSLIKWGSMPYWTQGAPKQYFISKMCATKQLCDEMKLVTLPRCERIGYNDWECSECCQGDRCNYYVTLGSSTTNCSWMMIGIGLVATVLVFFRK